MDQLVFKSLLKKDKPSKEEIRALPKVVLHEHLDGGLRPSTIIEIANEIGFTLPTTDLAELEKWFYDNCNSGSLVRYLQCFDITIQVMQRRKDLVRIAKECVLDLAEDNVIYGEIRYAPELFVNDDLDYDTIIQAVNEGFALGMEEVNANNAFSLASSSTDSDKAAKAKYRYPIQIKSLLCAMRQHSNAVAERVAELAIAYRDDHVAGFDIAGPENGFPPRRHTSAFDKLRRQNMHFTIHAGEDFGLPSIWEAIQLCGTDRLGHGVRIVDDIFDAKTNEPVAMQGFFPLENNTSSSSSASASTDSKSASIKICNSVCKDTVQTKVKLGRLASYVRDKRIALEICPTSNLQTGCVPNNAIVEHPIHLLHLLRFRVTVNTDNRLMSGTTMTRELSLLVDTFHWTLADIQRVTINALKSSFLPFEKRVYLIKQIVKPAYKDMVAQKHSSHANLFISHSSRNSSKLGLRVQKDESTSMSSRLAEMGLTEGESPLVIDEVQIMTAEEAEADSEGGEEDEDDGLSDDDEQPEGEDPTLII